MSLDPKNICIVILAGGRGKRMQEKDKGLIIWREKTLVEHVLSHLPANSNITINANRNLDEYKRFGYPVVSDSIDNFQGPLAGILSAMQICEQKFILCLPCDSPKPPERLSERLFQCLTIQDKDCAICHDGERTQPLFSLLKCSTKNQLETFLNDGHRKVHDFFKKLDSAVCDFSDQAEFFKNFNTPDDLNEH